MAQKKGRSLVETAIMILLAAYTLFYLFIGTSSKHDVAKATTKTNAGSEAIPKTSLHTENGSQGPRSKIGKVTMLYGESNPVSERALESHQRHADLHGYEMLVNRQKMLGRRWTKPAWLLSIVLQEMAKPPTERLEWLFWFDADTFILNPLLPLEMYLPPKDLGHIHLLCGKDQNGLNGGAFLIRINDFAVHLLSAALSVETFRPEVDLKYSEQSAMEHMLNSNDVYRPISGTTYAEGFATIPQRWLNARLGPRNAEGFLDSKKQQAPNDVKQGDLLVHFRGTGLTKKKNMKLFMEGWEKNRDMWELALDETMLPQELAAWWKDFALEDKRRRKQKEEQKQQLAAEEQDTQPDIDPDPPARKLRRRTL